MNKDILYIRTLRYRAKLSWLNYILHRLNWYFFKKTYCPRCDKIQKWNIELYDHDKYSCLVCGYIYFHDESEPIEDIFVKKEIDV